MGDTTIAGIAWKNLDSNIKKKSIGSPPDLGHFFILIKNNLDIKLIKENYIIKIRTLVSLRWNNTNTDYEHFYIFSMIM